MKWIFCSITQSNTFSKECSTFLQSKIASNFSQMLPIHFNLLNMEPEEVLLHPSTSSVRRTSVRRSISQPLRWAGEEMDQETLNRELIREHTENEVSLVAWCHRRTTREPFSARFFSESLLWECKEPFHGLKNLEMIQMLQKVLDTRVLCVTSQKQHSWFSREPFFYTRCESAKNPFKV